MSKRVANPPARALLALGAAVGLVLLGLVGAAPRVRADVIYLEGGGKVRGEIIEETETEIIVKTPFGSTHVIPLDEVSRIEREGNPKATFQRRFAAVAADDAGGLYELGIWAKGKGLAAQAKQAFEKAISADPDHPGARRELGYKRHRGTWYDAEAYKSVVQGLVKWKGAWVTPAAREFLAAGFVKNAQGEWIRTEDLERQRTTPPRSSSGGSSAGRVPPRRPRRRPRAPQKKPPTELDETNTAWYDDHQTVRTWEAAQATPYKSRYYDIYTNIKPEYAKRYGRMLDTYSVKGYQRVFNAKKNLPGGIPRSKVYIYPDQRAFMAGEGVGESVGGYYQSGRGRVVCYHGRFGMTGTTKTVLVHEATHQFEDYVLPGKMWNAPIWIIEGFAVFFESARYDYEKERVIIGHIPRDRLMNMKQGLRTGTLIPLSELIRTSQPQFTAFHYAHAWSLIYYMVYGGSSKKKAGRSCTHRPHCKSRRAHNQRIFSDLFFLARTKRVSPEDTEALFGGKKSFEAFEEQWKQWLADVPYDFDPKTQDFEDIQKEKERKAREGKEREGGGSGSGAGPGRTRPRESRAPESLRSG